MFLKRLRSACLVALLVAGCSKDQGAAKPPASIAVAADSAGVVDSGSPLLPGLQAQWTGDLDGMIKRHRIRVLVTLSRTNFFIDRGSQRGTTHDAMVAFEAALNAKLKARKELPVSIVFIPVVRDQLLPALIEGRGDIAAANLSVTEPRLKDVDFGTPFLTGVSEVVVTGPSSPPVQTLADLSGREVFVRRSSSYASSLHRVNDSLRVAHRKPIVLRPADEHLEDEDILEMVNAGVEPATIVDGHVARFWSGVYDSLVVHPGVTVATDGAIAWAIRKHSPELKAAVDEFARTHGKGTTFGNILDQRYWRNVGYVRNPGAASERARLRTMATLFKKYGEQYGFDYLLLAAQAYQESRLDQSVRSSVGAVGVMQVMPTTASDPNVAIKNIELLEPNIHAGSKYMRFLLDRYFKGDHLDSLNQGLFAFASYNAGPARVARLRARAQANGLNPDVWFNNVEIVAAQDIGAETVTYVRNIFKYYVAYTLLTRQQQSRERAKAR